MYRMRSFDDGRIRSGRFFIVLEILVEMKKRVFSRWMMLCLALPACGYAEMAMASEQGGGESEETPDNAKNDGDSDRDQKVSFKNPMFDENKVALGRNAQSLGGTSIAIGPDSCASDGSSVAIGFGAKAQGDSISIGQSSGGKGRTAVSVGHQATAALDSIAVGYAAKAEDGSSVALGKQSEAKYYSVALGHNSHAKSHNSISMGYNSNVMENASSSLALGAYTRVDGVNSVALGVCSQVAANEKNVVSVGHPTMKRRLVNVAEGTKAGEAVTYEQLKALEASTVSREYFNRYFYNLGNVDALLTGKYDQIIGDVTKKVQDGFDGQTVSLVKKEFDGAREAFDVSQKERFEEFEKRQAEHEKDVDAKLKSIDFVAGNAEAVDKIVTSKFEKISESVTQQIDDLKNQLPADSSSELAALEQAHAADAGEFRESLNNQASTIVRLESWTRDFGRGEGAGSHVFGDAAKATGEWSLSLGAQTQCTAFNSVALGAFSQASEANVVSVGNEDLKRRIINVENGSGLHDAVNVQQLKQLEDTLRKEISKANTCEGGSADELISNRIDKLQKAYDGIGGLLDEKVASSVKGLDSRISEVAGKVDNNELEIKRVDEGLKNLSEQHKSDLASVTEKMTEVKEVKESLELVVKDVDDVKKDVDGVKQDVDGIKKDVAQVKQDAHEFGEKLGQVAESVEHNTNAIGELDEGIKNLQETSKHYEKDLTELGEKVDANSRDLNEHKNVMDELDGKLAGLEKKHDDDVVKIETSMKDHVDGPDYYPDQEQPPVDSWVPSRPMVPEGPMGPAGRPGVPDISGGAVCDCSDAMDRLNADKVEIGDGAQSNAAESVALGKGASVAEGAESAVALGAASEAIEKDTVSVGNDQLQRRIVNVAAARDDHDAVNLAQLREYAAQTDTRIKRLDRDMKRGFARQSALSALMAPVGIGKCNVTAALGGSGSTTALAVGAGYRPNNHVAVRFGVSGNTGSSSTVDYNVGASYEW